MDSAQAEILANSLNGIEVGGWFVDGFFGKGKSAVVMSCLRGTQEGAIKVFHPELIERYGRAVQLERIKRERSLIGASHPNLVNILDGGECNKTGHLYVVMERLPYPNMHEVLSDIPSEAIPSLMAQIASAARFLEDRNLAHRDIKPENIAISPDFSKAILLDLGVLRPIGLSNLTDVDQRPFIGTLRYSSPEFLRREEKDNPEGWRALTFYQLGAVLHDLLMKEVLFEEYSEPFPRLVQAVNEITPKIHAENARCVALANHCLIKNPTTRVELISWERFQSLATEDALPLVAARDRIMQRQKYFQAAIVQGMPAERSYRLSRKALDDLCNRIESRIAALMNDLQAFPLRTTQSLKDIEKGISETYIHFERDEQKGLPFRLAILIRVVLIDENLGKPIFRAEAAATLANGEVSVGMFPAPVAIQSGELELLLDSPSLEIVFLRALDDAYTRIEQGKVPSGGGIVSLAISEEML